MSVPPAVPGAARVLTPREAAARLEIVCDCPCDPLPCQCPSAVAERYLAAFGRAAALGHATAIRHVQRAERTLAFFGPCECPVRLAPCPHVLAMDPERFPISWEQWVRLMDSLDPDPPPPDAPGIVARRQARVDLYFVREHEGRGLRHPDDFWRARLERFADHVAVSIVGRLGNGRAGGEDVVAQRRLS